VDRMDYLLRDSYHTGVAYGRFDHNRLIDTSASRRSHRVVSRTSRRRHLRKRSPNRPRRQGRALPAEG
jgi:hypothetical protein